MSTFAEDILEEAGEEEIEAIVIGLMGWDSPHSDDPPEQGYNAEGKPPWGAVLNLPIPWNAALPLLSYDYSSGFGAPDCQAIYAWTPTRVIFVSQYDGSTSIHSIPRNPCECAPEMPGG